MKPITMSSWPVKEHIRWAKSQQHLNPTLVKESQAISTHAEITSSSSLYTPHFSQLFGLHKCNLPWAQFTPPPRSSPVKKSTFSSRWLSLPTLTKQPGVKLGQLDHIDMETDGEEPHQGPAMQPFLTASALMYYQTQEKPTLSGSDDEENEDEGKPSHTPFKRIKRKIPDLPKLAHHTAMRFEKDKMALSNLMEVLEWIHALLRQIQATSIKFQKG